METQHNTICMFDKVTCCIFQFDNVKRVFKQVEEMMGSLVDNIKTHFLLSEQLAQYVYIFVIRIHCSSKCYGL